MESRKNDTDEVISRAGIETQMREQLCGASEEGVMNVQGEQNVQRRDFKRMIHTTQKLIEMCRIVKSSQRQLTGFELGRVNGHKKYKWEEIQSILFQGH